MGLLLGGEDVNLDTLDCSGVILLSLATENFVKPLVGLLRTRETKTPRAGEQRREVFRDFLPLNVYICRFCNITTVYTLIRKLGMRTRQM